jgi:hypothetical protein
VPARASAYAFIMSDVARAGPAALEVFGMLTLQECLDLSGLEAEEIDAIAEHERIPEIAAAELGCCLLATIDGRRRIRGMIADDLSHARSVGDRRHAAALRSVLSRYISAHPDCVR